MNNYLARKILGMRKCPVCGEDFPMGTARLHITKAAGSEARMAMIVMMNHSKGKPYTFSPRIVLRNAPHWSYYRKQNRKKVVRFVDAL